MKEARELQTQIEQLERHIKLQSNLIEAQTVLIRRQDEKIINLAFDLEYERHSATLKGKK